MAAIEKQVMDGARRVAYGAAQAARIAWFTSHYALGRRLMGPLTAPGDAPYADEFEPLDQERLRCSFSHLFKREWQFIKDGVYKMPLEVRSRPRPLQAIRKSRDYLRDTRKVARRRAHSQNAEVNTAPNQEKYPRYYLQNFHFQSDGWLSAASAERYRMQVETLFTGAAGAMRRAALPYIRAHTEKVGRDARLLDLACGDGGFLRDVMDNFPNLQPTALGFITGLSGPCPSCFIEMAAD